MPTTEQATQPVISDEQIETLLERLGKAVSEGDLQGIASCFVFPALFLSDEGALAFAERNEIEKFFAQAIADYRSRGQVATRPEVGWTEPLTEKLIAVDVRWPAFDAAGTEVSTEWSHYVVQLGQDGKPRIRVALTRTVGVGRAAS